MRDAKSLLLALEGEASGVAVTSGIGNLLPYGYTDQVVPGPVPYGLLVAPAFIG
jgi:hypothetical protein